MSFTIYPEARAIEVDAGFLPQPATKLVVTQHLCSESLPPRWAWIVVGAFYDEDDNIIWSTEVFVAHLDVELESDSESGSEAGSEEDTNVGLDVQVTPPESPRHVQSPVFDAAHRSNYLYGFRPQLSPTEAFLSTLNPIQPRIPPQPHLAAGYWDPTLYRPAPGHWVASFDSTIGRWVHTWQPRY